MYLRIYLLRALMGVSQCKKNQRSIPKKEETIVIMSRML